MKVVDVKRVSELTGTKVKTIYQWARTGQLPCFKINGCLRFDEEEILAWIEACKRGERTGIIWALRPTALAGKGVSYGAV